MQNRASGSVLAEPLVAALVMIAMGLNCLVSSVDICCYLVYPVLSAPTYVTSVFTAIVSIVFERSSGFVCDMECHPLAVQKGRIPTHGAIFCSVEQIRDSNASSISVVAKWSYLIRYRATHA